MGTSNLAALYDPSGNYDSAKQAAIQAEISRVVNYDISTYHGGSDRGGTGTQLNQIGARPQADDLAYANSFQSQRPDLFAHRPSGGLSGFIGKVIEVGVPIVVVTGITAGTLAVAGVGPMAAGGSLDSGIGATAGVGSGANAGIGTGFVTGSSVAAGAPIVPNAAGSAGIGGFSGESAGAGKAGIFSIVGTKAGEVLVGTGIAALAKKIFSPSGNTMPAPQQTINNPGDFQGGFPFSSLFGGGGSGSGGGSGGGGDSASSSPLLPAVWWYVAAAIILLFLFMRKN